MPTSPSHERERRRIKWSRPAPQRGLAVLAAALSLTAAAGEAAADLKLCNRTGRLIDVAIGYRDTKGWATEGWFQVAAQSCGTVLKGDLPSQFIYVHAVDSSRGGEWSGTFVMCTSDKSFMIRDVKDCQRRGYKRTRFFEVNTQDAKEWTVQFTDPEEAGARPR